MPGNNNIAVTGAGGYLGAQLCGALSRHGLIVTRLGRNPGTGARAFDLAAENYPQLLEGISVLIHSAWDMSASNQAEIESINVQGSLKLLASAKTKGIPVIFISSMAAFQGCKSSYGQSKLRVEAQVISDGGVVVRPGTIYGAVSGGIVEKILGIMKRFHFAPLIGGGGQSLYVVDIEVACSALLKVVKSIETYRGKILMLAEAQPIKLSTFFKHLAQSRGVKALMLPVPSFIIYLPLRFLEIIGLKPPLRSDSVVSITNVIPQQQAMALEKL